MTRRQSEWAAHIWPIFSTKQLSSRHISTTTHTRALLYENEHKLLISKGREGHKGRRVCVALYTRCVLRAVMRVNEGERVAVGFEAATYVNAIIFLTLFSFVCFFALVFVFVFVVYFFYIIFFIFIFFSNEVKFLMKIYSFFNKYFFFNFT